jgi:hypothetical protein
LNVIKTLNVLSLSLVGSYNLSSGDDCDFTREIYGFF